jgi:hypothetical protein
LAFEGIPLLLEALQGGVGLGTEVYTVRPKDLGTFPLGLLLQAQPPLVQHVVHPLLESGLPLE